MPETWRNTDYAHRKEVVVQEANLDGDETNFPFLVVIDADTDLNTGTVQADLDDIRFYDGSGNLLKHEVEHYTIDGTSCTAYIWAKKPALYTSPSGTDNTIWMYYGYASAVNGEDAANTWDDNYRGVYHLGPSLDLTDSKGTIGTLTNGTLVSATTGVIDGGGSFPGGLEGQLNVAYDITNVQSNLTIEFWFNTTNNIYTNGIFQWADGATSGTPAVLVQRHSGTAIRLLLNDGYNITPSATINDDTWYHFALTYNATDKWKCYIDGAPDGTYGGDYSGTSGNSIWFGNGYGQSMIGALDEGRISGLSRSAAWIKFEYNNVAQADNEQTWGAEEDQPAGGASIAVFMHHYTKNIKSG